MVLIRLQAFRSFTSELVVLTFVLLGGCVRERLRQTLPDSSNVMFFPSTLLSVLVTCDHVESNAVFASNDVCEYSVFSFASALPWV